MPNQHATLRSLFQDIADAIRQQDGTSAGIIADNFPNRIRTLSLGAVIKVPTEAELDSYLTSANKGKAYEYTGPNGKYNRGFIYVVSDE